VDKTLMYYRMVKLQIKNIDLEVVFMIAVASS